MMIIITKIKFNDYEIYKKKDEIISFISNDL